MRNKVTPTFWRAWPLLVASDDFDTKSEARWYCERNGGGAIRKLRWISDYVTESSTDSIEIPERARMTDRYIIRKLDYSGRPWRIIDTHNRPGPMWTLADGRDCYPRGVVAEGTEVWLPEVFDHPMLGETVINGPVAFDRKRDAVAALSVMLEQGTLER